MQKALLLSTLLLLSTARAQEEPVGFASDSRLQVSTSLRLKIVSLKEFTESLGKQVKVSLSVAPAIADRKITAIFHDRSAADAMAALQSAMFMQWVKDGAGYRLNLDRDVALEERAVIYAEAEAVRTRLIKELTSQAEAMGQPESEIQRRTRAVDDQISALRDDSSPGVRIKLEQLQVQRYHQYNTYVAGLAKAYVSDIPSVADALLAGQTLFASTLPLPPIPRLGQQFEEHLHAETGIDDALVMVRYDPESKSIKYRALIFLGGDRRTVWQDGLDHRLAPPEDVKSSKLAERLARWQAGADIDVLNKPISKQGRDELRSGYLRTAGGAGLTLAEHLEYLADHADIPVIGDAFRIFCSGDTFGSQQTVRGYLEGLLQAKHGGTNLFQPPVGAYGAQKGWLFVRHRDYWRRLATEIPEDVLRPIEESARIHDFASIDDYTSFLDKLTFDQAQPMYRENTRESDFAFKFSTRSLDYCYLSLKLWGMLSPEQKKSAQSAGLSLNTISGEQNKALIEIWIDQIWKGRIPADLWPSVFASGAADLQPVLTCRLRVNSSEDATFDYRLSTGFSFGQVFDVQQAH